MLKLFGVNKVVERITIVLALVVLGASAAQAQIPRTLSLNCNNLPALVTAAVTSFAWTNSAGTPLEAVDTSTLSCSGDGSAPPLDVVQPTTVVGIDVQGATYTITFSDGTPGCTVTTGVFRPGSALHLRDVCGYPGKNAGVIIRLGH